MLEIRPATFEEILNLRHEVLRAGRPLESAYYPGDESGAGAHWGAWSGGELAACVSLYTVEGPSTQLRGAATAPHWRNQGIGEALMRAAIAAWWSDTSAPRNLWCNARVAAITLYERLGFVAEGERFEFPQVGPHQRMRWVAP
jgi:GNAT superfamily N-acetyltransferase